MTSPTASNSRPLLPAVAVPWWAFALTTVGLLLSYLVLQDNGVLLSSGAAELMHEFFHDGRHALGVPCH